MENLYAEYWERPEVDWHARIPHHYHVSQIGVDHSDKDPSEHYGPCLRQSFYKIVDELPKAPSSRGNLRMGNILHEQMQLEEKLKNPSSIIEFPVYIELERLARKISASGSIDIVDFIRCCYPQLFDTVDIKTASSYTLPKGDYDFNPTYFAQVMIYTYILQNFYFNPALIKARFLEIRYIDKHNAGVYVVRKAYDHEEAEKAFKSFVDRCFKLDEHLENNTLPETEPMKWCKYCEYRSRCTANALTDENTPSFTMEELEEMYHTFTGKNALWRGNYTNAFKGYISGFKIKE